MPLVKANTNNPIRGVVKRLTARERSQCQAVIAKLTFADMSRQARTLHTIDNVRLDMQGHTATGVNLQVQIKDGTAAAALIANTALATRDAINQAGVRNGAISVLNQSLDSQTIWTLTGTLP